jgi:hypothetical protein
VDDSVADRALNRDAAEVEGVKRPFLRRPRVSSKHRSEPCRSSNALRASQRKPTSNKSNGKWKTMSENHFVFGAHFKIDNKINRQLGRAAHFFVRQTNEGSG